MTRKIISFLALLASDFASLAAAFSLACLIGVLFLGGHSPSLPVSPAAAAARMLILFIPWVFMFSNERLYTRRVPFGDEVRLLLKSTTAAFALVLGLSFLNPRFVVFSRPVIVLAWILSFIILPLFRTLVKKFLIFTKMWRKRVLLISSAQDAPGVIRTVRENKTLGYDIIGVLTAEGKGQREEFEGVRVLGDIDGLNGIQGRVAFDHLIINLPHFSADQLASLFHSWENLSEVIHFIPRTGNLITAGVEAEAIGRIMSLTIRRNLAKPWNLLIKAAFDLAVSAVLLLLLAPVFVVIAAAIGIDSRGSVFFIQTRHGRKGRSIRLIKFRTMFKDAEARLANFLRENSSRQAEWNEFRKLKNGDPRITRVGRLLRKFSLDELPQLVNVLKREMSLVGPRPYLVEELRELESVRSILFQVRPGLTGLWQVSGRSDVSFSERLNLDEYYVRNWSFWLDIVILLKTLPAALTGKGAF